MNMQKVHQQNSYNVNIVSFDRANRNPVQSKLTKLSKLYKQNEQTFEIVGDFIGAISLFAMLFVGLFFVGVFQ